MKKLLFSFMLMIVFAVPIQAAVDVSAPTYQVDVTHQVVADVSEPVAIAVNRTSQSNVSDVSLVESAPRPQLVLACDNTDRVNVVRVWGDSIGVGRAI